MLEGGSIRLSDDRHGTLQGLNVQPQHVDGFRQADRLHSQQQQLVRCLRPARRSGQEERQGDQRFQLSARGFAQPQLQFMLKPPPPPMKPLHPCGMKSMGGDAGATMTVGLFLRAAFVRSAISAALSGMKM